MELDEFIKNFADCFEDVAEDSLSGKTAYKELEEWSSMTALAIIAMVDEEYGKAVSSSDFKNSETIEELFNIVKAK